MNSVEWISCVAVGTNLLLLWWVTIERAARAEAEREAQKFKKLWANQEHVINVRRIR